MFQTYLDCSKNSIIILRIAVCEDRYSFFFFSLLFLINVMSDRDLLVADLCFRLPYGVFCYVHNYSNGYDDYYELVGVNKDGSSVLLSLINAVTGQFIEVYPSEVVPYLLPIESVGENFNHFAKTAQDINGLISRGLAINVNDINLDIY